MNNLGNLLESTKKNHNYKVTFLDGEIYILTNFEMVDESIYNSLDVCVADVISVIKSESKVITNRVALEFSVNDIARVEDVESNKVLYEVKKKKE